MKLDIIKLILTVESSLNRSDGEKIRGYLGNLFWDNPYAHQHSAEGRLIYRYPCVQYKIINGDCILIGFNEGLDVIKRTFDELKEINLDGELREILSKGLESYSATFALSPNVRHYSFLTPWLALNEKNYEQYQKLGTWTKRKQLLEKILIGNIISMSKSLGYTVPEPIKAKIINLKEVSTKLKGIPMLGFFGTFSVNFDIPDYFGIGKSVSRGFGTVVKVEDKKGKS